MMKALTFEEFLQSAYYDAETFETWRVGVKEEMSRIMFFDDWSICINSLNDIPVYEIETDTGSRIYPLGQYLLAVRNLYDDFYLPSVRD